MDLRVQRLHPAVEHLGRTGDLPRRVVTGIPASAIAVAVLPDDTSSTPSSCSPAGEVDETGLVVDGQQRALDLGVHVRAPRSVGDQLSITSGYRRRSTSLMRSCSVSSVSSSSTGTASWARIGPESTSSVTRCTVRPGDLHARRERVAHRVPALERRAAARDACSRPAPPKASTNGFERIVPKPGDRDEIDVVALEHVDDVVRVGDPVEGLGRSRCARRARPRHRAARAMSSAAHGRSARATTTGQLPVEHRLEDGSTSRCEDSDPHASHPIHSATTSGPISPRSSLRRTGLRICARICVGLPNRLRSGPRFPPPFVFHSFDEFAERGDAG